MATVGDTLSTERRRQGKSVADVVEATKIRTRMIDALEHGDWSSLPSPAYVKGYIQSYARYLEIPAEPLLEQYRAETARLERGGASARGSERYLADIPAEQIVPERHEQHAIPQQLWIAVAVVLVAVALVVYGIAQLFRTDSATPLPKAGETSGTLEPAGADEPTTTVTTPEQTGDFKLRITVRPGMASWVHVTLDGLEAYQGTLNGGESREWLVTVRAVVEVSKPSAVTVTRGGQVVKLTKPATGNATVTLDTGQ